MSRRGLLRNALRVGIILGVAALAHYYWQDLVQASRELSNLDALVLLILPLFVVWNWIAAFAWLELHAVLATGRPPSAWRLSVIRAQAQAVNLLVPLASIGGEVLRASILSRQTGQTKATTSAVVLDKIADSASGLLFVFMGLALGVARGADAGGATTIVLAGLSVIIAGFVPVFLRRLSATFGNSESQWIASLAPLMETDGLFSVAFYRAMGYHLIERILSAGEIYIAMLAAGIVASPVDAVFIAAVMTAYGFFFFFVPGQAGASEAGIVSAFVSLGLPANLGLTIALVRRGRQFFVVIVGATTFFGARWWHRAKAAPVPAQASSKEKR